LSTRM